MKSHLAIVPVIAIAACSGSRAPECDEHMGAPYPCSGAAAQVKSLALDDAYGYAGRDGLTSLQSDITYALNKLNTASTQAEIDAACAFADFWLGQVICDYDSSSYPDWSTLVNECRSARAAGKTN
jgi:hypothetical protein